jgi:hypothetical protein
MKTGGWPRRGERPMKDLKGTGAEGYGTGEQEPGLCKPRVMRSKLASVSRGQPPPSLSFSLSLSLSESPPYDIGVVFQAAFLP